jgi:hypothetical protein
VWLSPARVIDNCPPGHFPRAFSRQANREFAEDRPASDDFSGRPTPDPLLQPHSLPTNSQKLTLILLAAYTEIGL